MDIFLARNVRASSHNSSPHYDGSWAEPHSLDYGSVRVCVFIKLHITAQSGPVILAIYATRIDPPKGGSMILIAETCVCMYLLNCT